ncbi:HD-GYP domain-containing protein [Gimesia aquarii]|uniref:HD domain protein n=1 Tax=Gimesia aquarii TaxID=2527964 RepID=A0A517WPA8_9PLAN|nr:HD domain-containing phosphohydrolase [Gimesia aquarii]QDU07066.1 HD domain protein [Gimesia aquarii]
MNHSNRLLRWLAPSIREEREEWKALRLKSEPAAVIESGDAQLQKLSSTYRELKQQNLELTVPKPQRTLIQLQNRIQVILERCRLYLGSEPTHSLCPPQLPILERILNSVREEQQYIKQQLLLSQTVLHYVSQFKEATQEIWTKPFCSPNYLLNLLRKIKNDDVHLTSPGEFLFLSIEDFLAVAHERFSDEDMPVYIRGLETARLIYFVSRQHEDWQKNVDFLMLAGLLHDFGWLMLKHQNPDKDASQSKLLHDERGEHPVLGAALLGGLRGFPGDSSLSEVISQHHERLDGTGYPRRLHTYALNEHSRRMAVVCRYLELKNNRRELTADGIRSYDMEEVAFAAALQLYREAKRGEWDQRTVDHTLSALDTNLPEALRETDQKNDLFSLKRFQHYRQDASHTQPMKPHIHSSSKHESVKQASENQQES